jgi:hypothetical protein
MADPVCVRCDGPLVPPNGADRWTCLRHGPVEPLHRAVPAEPHHLADAASSAAVPVWLPWPPPRDWVATGVRRTAGTGMARGVVLAFSGPGVTERQAELLVVAEEPGVGLGAAYAGLDTADPGPELATLPADTKVSADGHSIPLWSLPVLTGDRAVYVGEAAGCWLWAIVWPVTEWMVVHDDLRLVDLRAPEHRLHVADVPTGALCPRLTR